MHRLTAAEAKEKSTIIFDLEKELDDIYSDIQDRVSKKMTFTLIQLHDRYGPTLIRSICGNLSMNGYTVNIVRKDQMERWSKVFFEALQPVNNSLFLRIDWL